MGNSKMAVPAWKLCIGRTFNTCFSKIFPAGINTSISKVNLNPVLHQQTCGIAAWQMSRDKRRRQTLKEYGPLRLRLNSIRKNELLPKELQEVADKEIADLPKDSSITRVVNRCIISGRARGTVRGYRISRINWRKLADYSKLPGIKRSQW